MKIKTTLFIAILGLGFFNLSSCKKGTEDPFFSFKTREARMKGEWQLTNVTGEEKSQNYNGTYSYSNGVLTFTKTDGSFEKSNLDIQLKFEKGQRAQMVYFVSTTDSEDPSYGKYTIEGFYNFLGKAEELDLKKKEAFLLTSKKETYEEDGESDVYEYENSDYGLRFTLIRLTNKEMKVSFQEIGTSKSSMSSHEYSSSQIWTFKKK